MCIYIYVFVNRWVCKQYYLALSGSATLEGPGHQKKICICYSIYFYICLIHFLTQSSACVCICCGMLLHVLWHLFAFVVAFVLWHLFAFVVAFVCICCGMCLHLLWHLSRFALHICLQIY